MNGARADVPAKKTRNPINSSIRIIGISQNFFLANKKFHKSFNVSIRLLYFIY